MNDIFCPICGSPYFLSGGRFKEVAKQELPKHIYRACISCGYELKFEKPSEKTTDETMVTHG